MLIFGVRKVHLKTIELPNTICPTCGTEGDATLSVWRKHFHLFWVPMFPVGKKGEYQCHHCSKTLSHKKLPIDIKEEYQILKKQTKGPIWQFAGLVVLAILITFIVMAINENEALDAAYIAEPKIGDVYEIKTTSRDYTTLKTVRIVNDTLFVAPNRYETSKIMKIYKIDKPENYLLDSLQLFTKEELHNLYETNEIISVKREE